MLVWLMAKILDRIIGHHAETEQIMAANQAEGLDRWWCEEGWRYPRGGGW